MRTFAVAFHARPTGTMYPSLLLRHTHTTRIRLLAAGHRHHHAHLRKPRGGQRREGGVAAPDGGKTGWTVPLRYGMQVPGGQVQSSIIVIAHHTNTSTHAHAHRKIRYILSVSSAEKEARYEKEESRLEPPCTHIPHPPPSASATHVCPSQRHTTMICISLQVVLAMEIVAVPSKDITVSFRSQAPLYPYILALCNCSSCRVSLARLPGPLMTCIPPNSPPSLLVS
jgi:hypothetical protein